MAKLLKTSQPRVTKLEAGASEVSLEMHSKADTRQLAPHTAPGTDHPPGTWRSFG